jgi:hypothetical protein
MRRFVYILGLVVLLIPWTIAARTWYVTPGGTGDAPTIQAGLDSAVAGDTVLVECGTYYEHDIIMKSAVTLRSTTGDPTCVTIDAQQLGRVIYCSYAHHTTRIEGFTLTGGLVAGNNEGGGLYCYDRARPRLAHLVFHDNHVGAGVEGYGGGMAASWGSQVHLRDAVFSGNSAGAGGGLFFAEGNVIRLTEVVFMRNTCKFSGGGLAYEVTDSAFLDNVSFIENTSDNVGGGMFCSHVQHDHIIRDCLFEGNSCNDIGGGVFIFTDNPDLYNCTFVENSAEYGGGLGCDWYFGPHLHSCTFYGNHATYGCCIAGYYYNYTELFNTILSYGTGGSALYSFPEGDFGLTCCDIYGNEGGDWVGVVDQLGIRGNIQTCPAFCNVATEPYDFHLCDGSACAPGNHPDGYDCGLIGAWDVGCSCGPTTAQPSTWGGIKALFR